MMRRKMKQKAFAALPSDDPYYLYYTTLRGIFKMKSYTLSIIV